MGNSDDFNGFSWTLLRLFFLNFDGGSSLKNWQFAKITMSWIGEACFTTDSRLPEGVILCGMMPEIVGGHGPGDVPSNLWVPNFGAMPIWWVRWFLQKQGPEFRDIYGNQENWSCLKPCRNPIVLMSNTFQGMYWIYCDFRVPISRVQMSNLEDFDMTRTSWSSRSVAFNKEITLLRVIPTMTSIRFVSGKSAGVLSDISSRILSGTSSGILSGISSGSLPGIFSAICSGISSGTLSGISSGISSDILSGILSGKSFGICSGKHSGTLFGIPSGILSDILSGIPSGILSGISSGILSGKHSGTLSGISFGILSDILSGVLSGISSGILSGRWGPAVLTELGGSQVEVQRCSLSSEGPRLRSSGAHWARTVPGWGPAVLTELGRSQVEVQRCPVRSDSCSWGPAVPTACGSWRRVGKAEVDMEVDAKVVQEKLEEREEEEKEVEDEEEEEPEEENNCDKI